MKNTFLIVVVFTLLLEMARDYKEDSGEYLLELGERFIYKNRRWSGGQRREIVIVVYTYI